MQLQDVDSEHRASAFYLWNYEPDTGRIAFQSARTSLTNKLHSSLTLLRPIAQEQRWSRWIRTYEACGREGRFSRTSRPIDLFWLDSPFCDDWFTGSFYFHLEYYIPHARVILFTFSLSLSRFLIDDVAYQWQGASRLGTAVVYCREKDRETDVMAHTYIRILHTCTCAYMYRTE